jgi:hypothetical protein
MVGHAGLEPWPLNGATMSIFTHFNHVHGFMSFPQYTRF